MLYLVAKGHAAMARAAAGAATPAAAAAAAGAALRDALLANANLGGDCTHRGMLLGAALGACAGAAAIPPDLLAGLAAARPGSGNAEAIAALAAAVERGCVAGAGGAGTRAPRFGRPAPLLRAPGALLPRAPRDFPQKLAAVEAHAARAGGYAELRYVKGVGPCAPRGAELVPLEGGGGGGGGGGAPALAMGDAERDRLALLAEESAAGAREGAGVSSLAAAAAAAVVSRALADAAEATAAELEGARVAAGALPGTGVFFVAAPRELSARLAAAAAARRSAAAAGVDEDPVVARLAREYGVDVAPFFRRGWGLAQSGGEESLSHGGGGCA